MRLFLLPVSTRRTLIYCERLREISANTAPGSKPPLTERVITKANQTWVSWEKAKGGWQKTITNWGNALLRRVPFEEYGLKSLPPGTKKRLEEIDAGKLRLKCLYPAAFVRADDGQRRTGGDEKAIVTKVLEKLAKERQSLHWNRLVYCLIGMPISAPFMIVPVLPNLPFYYLCYRAYCHYRALYGSKTLEHLLKKNAIDLAPSTKLEEIYTAGLSEPDVKTVQEVPPLTTQQIEESANRVDKQLQDGTKEVMLLKRWNGDLLAEHFQLPEMEVEIERAVEQVEKALKSEQAQEQQAQDTDTKGGKQS